MDTALQRECLSQREALQHLLRRIGPTEMVTVSGTTYSHGGRQAIYSALIPSVRIDPALSHSSWDLSHGQGLPGSEYGLSGSMEYLRFGNSEGIEPLVIDRHFHGVRDDHVEISEEFRLFHKLYHDQQQGRYVKFDANGDETVVAILEQDLVKIRMKEIRQFLAIKEMYLSIQFECVAYSAETLADLELARGAQKSREGLACWSLSYNDWILGEPGRRTVSILDGKRMIAPLPKSKSGFEGFAEEQGRQYQDFIIGMNNDGEEISHTCNPDVLSDYFGKNPGAPHHLAAVSFRKQVLGKYYQEPSKYKIIDGLLSCGSLWSLDIDNHHDDKVCVQLGDLGYLDYPEQLHWRSYNIVSETGFSVVAFRRDFLAQWADSDRPEHAFQGKYNKLVQVCQETLGWSLLRPLAEGDKYHLQNIRVPATDEQQDFDGLVLGLATILVDSINVEGLKTLVPMEQHTDEDGEPLRGIPLLNNVLTAWEANQPDGHVVFLRNLQSLRSSGSAHRKGSNYRKVAARFGVGDKDLRTVFAGILWQAVETLNYLAGVVEGQQAPACGNSIDTD